MPRYRITWTERQPFEIIVETDQELTADDAIIEFPDIVEAEMNREGGNTPDGGDIQYDDIEITEVE